MVPDFGLVTETVLQLLLKLFTQHQSAIFSEFPPRRGNQGGFSACFPKQMFFLSAV